MTKANLYAIRSINMTIALETHEADETAIKEFEEKIKRTWGDIDIQMKTENERNTSKEMLKNLKICKVGKIDLEKGRITGMKEIKILKTAREILEKEYKK